MGSEMCIRDSLDTVNQLNQASEGRTVILNLVKAHCGHVGNEKADCLAKEGGTSGNRVPVPTPKIEIKNRITKHFYSLWEKEFKEYDGARMGKEFYSGPDSNKAKYVYKLSRAHLSRFIRIIAGHNSLFYFRSKVDPDISPLCRFCLEENETFIHLVNDCPRFINDRRDKLLNALISNDHMWSVQSLIDFSSLPGINAALEGDTRIELYRYHEDIVTSSDYDSDTSSLD